MSDAVNTAEIAKRVGFGSVPAGGNATAGTVPRFTGSGLTVAEAVVPVFPVADAAGFLTNDGAGNMSWLKIYIESNVDLVYTVSNVGGGGQYNTIQAAVDAIQATGVRTPTYVIQIFPGTYTDNNIAVDGYKIVFTGSLLTGLPTFGGQSVELKYMAAPTSGTGYINLMSSTADHCIVSFMGIMFTHTNNAVVTTATNLFYIPAGGSSSSVVQPQFIYCRFNVTPGNTDSTLLRSDSATQTVNFYCYYTHFIYTLGSTATLGSAGYMSMFLFTANRAATLNFEGCSFNAAMSHASVALGITFNLRATTVAQNLILSYCKDLQVFGRTAAGNTNRFISILGTGSVYFLYSSLTLALSYNIDVIYFNGASGASATLRESSVHYLTNNGGTTIIAQSGTYSGGKLNVFGGTLTTAAGVTVLGTNMAYGTGSAFISTVGNVSNIADGTSYGAAKSAGVLPTHAKEDHSHGTPASILVGGGTKITVSSTEPTSPTNGDLWVDIS